MIDENLPTFYLRPSSDNVKHNASLLLSQYGSEAAPAYSLRHPDPASPSSKNRYAAALYDSYHPDILYGEVLLIPEWTQPSLSQEEIRKNGGVPPPPQPILPSSFVIQLYNPEQQVVVQQGVSKWSATPQWVFEMPQQSFRQPSVASIDRTQSDPTASETTPKFRFKWKKEGRLSKDYVCSLSGKNTNPDGSKRKNREPDITISIFKHLKEITMYESNLMRVDIEDPKGLEVVMLLSAIVIREVYNGNMRDTFNVSDVPRRLSGEAAPRKNSSERTRRSRTDAPPSQAPPQPSHPRPPLQIQTIDARPPPTDPRSQWEIDAESARLKKEVEREERERRHAEHAETKRVKKMLEEEERRARLQQLEIDKETVRLKRQFEREQRQAHRNNAPPPSLPSRPAAATNLLRPNFAGLSYPQPPVQRPHSANPFRPPAGPYLQGPANNASSSVFFGGGSSLHPPRPPDGRRVGSKPSIFGLLGRSNPSGQRLTRKQSAVF
ncbi:MAG: hypothetical protein LQ339_001532 [Xanthoria mediterranea]|nr:MAG: hypothetical protein LQ339_001532 [Xanthoria mediterranea]